jgi:small subunit ribosomal protein S9
MVAKEKSKKQTTKTKNTKATKSSVKAVKAIKEDANFNDEIQKPIVKRGAVKSPIHDLDKKGLKEFKGKYIEGVGRRKSSVARVRIYLKDKGLSINGKSLNEYFPIRELQDRFILPLELTDNFNKFAIAVKVSGGGFNAQCDAVVLGISRCLVKFDEKTRPILKKQGLLSRDARKVERKKPGLHKARRAPQ